MISESEVKYHNEWTLVLRNNNSSSFQRTPYFSPIIGVKLSMCFEYQLGIISRSHRHEKIFRLRLEKLSAEDVSARLLMDVKVALFIESDRRVFRASIEKVNVLMMSKLHIEDFVLDVDQWIDNAFEGLWDDMTLKCDMTFSDDFPISSPSNQATTRLSSTCVCSHNNLQQFIKDLSSLYESGDLSDVKFFVSDKSLSAHKSILAAHSPVFKTMLTGDFKEMQTNTITISDTTYEVFNEFLKYLYSGELLDQSWLNVKELYVLADKYDVPTLKRECQKIIPTLLSTHIVSEILILAFHYEDADLKKLSTEYAFAHIKTLSANEQWKSFVKSYPHIGYEVLENFIYKK